MLSARRICTFSLAALLCGAVGCSSDDGEPGEDGPACPAGEEFNPILGRCVESDVRVERDMAMRTPDASEDAGLDTPDLMDEDVPQEMGCQIDVDGDGSMSMECGGDDCDDEDPRRFPGNTDICDEVDNDCNGTLNDGVTCTILAHSNDRMYRLDFFAGTSVDIGPAVESLWDIDTHPDGTTYGIAGNKLHRFDEAAGTWTPAPGNLGIADQPNGFCIDNDGNAFVTSGESFTLRSVDLVQGTSTSLGSMAPAESSGDCVVNKGNVLYVTSRHTTPDSFARLDGATGDATIIGRTQHSDIWGLTAAYNRVFGLTAGGDVVEINVGTGATTVVASYPNISFYGAASTPER